MAYPISKIKITLSGYPHVCIVIRYRAEIFIVIYTFIVLKNVPHKDMDLSGQMGKRQHSNWCRCRSLSAQCEFPA